MLLLANPERARVIVVSLLFMSLQRAGAAGLFFVLQLLAVRSVGDFLLLIPLFLAFSPMTNGVIWYSTPVIPPSFMCPDSTYGFTGLSVMHTYVPA